MRDMKKITLLSFILVLLCISPVNAQVGKFLKNVKNNVQKDLLGTPGSKNTSAKSKPDPACACEQPDVIVDMDKYKIDYTESTISLLDDGSALIGDRLSDNFYVSRNGVTEGPFKKEDPRVARFQAMVQGSDNRAELTERFRNYITKQGDKYLITFAGKTYGPYALISKFAVSRSGEKFAAMVTQALAMTEAEGKAMEQKAKNAKTDEEKMQLAMEYSQQLQKKMMENGGPQAMQPKLISNVPVASGDNNMIMSLTTNFYSNLKYDDIVAYNYQKVMDLQGNTLLNISGAGCPPENMYIKSDNSGYATYLNGTLTLSDGKTMKELFNPHLVKIDGKIYLAYFYYSPKRNAILQCRIPF
jgi:hypothetical protein